MVENRIAQTVSAKMRLLRRTNSPRAQRRVQNGFFGESIGRLWRVHFLSRKSGLENFGVLPCFSDADRFAVFRRVHPCLDVNVCSVPSKDDEVETQIFALGNLVPVRGAVSWQSVCELQGETSSAQNLKSEAALIQESS